MSSKHRMMFEAECRACDHTIKRGLEATQELVEGPDFVRIRCKECRQINPIEQTGVL